MFAIYFGACASQPPVTPSPAQAGAVPAPTVTPWPEASSRFRAPGSSWLGADSAYSVDLGDRVLWLFGDTFIDPARDGSRTNGPNLFLRNTVALQSGSYDLSRAELAFVTGPERDGVPTSYFADSSSDEWFWPLHGARLPDGELILFRLRVIKVDTGFGFRVAGWDAIAIDEPQATASDYRPRTIARGSDPLLGASVLLDGEYLYAYAAKNRDDDHAITLARFRLAALHGLPEGALDDPEWYTAGGYQLQSAGAQAAVLIADGQTEFSVHFERRLGSFLEVQMRGLFVSDPNTAIVVRSAPRPEGPWSSATAVWKPPAAAGADASKLLAYAAKAHPEQRGADLVLTYVVNDVAHPAPLDAVYYPEVLRLTFLRRH
ncbi:MAG TPA: hypothetical protein VJR89_38265 [Polyangiales bacterium]|nr:hypothetical protein [Polyangiales bacterium]